MCPASVAARQRCLRGGTATLKKLSCPGDVRLPSLCRSLFYCRVRAGEQPSCVWFVPFSHGAVPVPGSVKTGMRGG